MVLNDKMPVEGLRVDDFGDVVFPKDSDFLGYLKRFCTMFQKDGNRYVKDFIEGGNIDDSVKLYCLWKYVCSMSQDNIVHDLDQDYGFMESKIKDEIILSAFKYAFKKYCNYILTNFIKYCNSSDSKNNYLVGILLNAGDSLANLGKSSGIFNAIDYFTDRFNYYTNKGIDDYYELISSFVYACADQVYECYYDSLKDKYTASDYNALIGKLSKLRKWSPFAAGVAINEVARVAKVNDINLVNVSSGLLCYRSLDEGCIALREGMDQPNGSVLKIGTKGELKF